MPTLKQVRQRALKLDPSLGRVELITGLTTTTVVCASLATGTVGAGKFSNKWVLRPDAALSGGVAVDRLRLTTSSGFAASTGTLTHAGTNYADTTVGTEQAEIHEFEPYLLEQAIQTVLRGTRFLDFSILPTKASDRYSMIDLSWINEPSDIVSVHKLPIPVLNNNRGFEKWNGYSSAGAIVPDGYTLAGSGATFARSTTTRTGPYSLSVTRSGTDATVSFTIPVLNSGVSEDSLRGETVTAVCVGRSGQANSLVVTIDSQKSDGTSILSEDSSAHTGGGSWEELAKEHTVSATADQIVVTATVNVDETALLDEFYLCIGSLTDGIRRNTQTGGYRVGKYQFEQGQPPRLRLAAGSRGAQLLIKSQRPYAAFDETRITSGLADSDTTDCPLDLLAYGALYRLYEDLPESPDQMRKAEKYRRIFNQLQAQHLADDNQEENRGAEIIPPPRASTIARVR